MTYPKRGAVAQVFSATGWVFGIFALVGLAIVVPAVFLLAQAWQLYAHGVQVTGKVDKLWQTEDRCGNNNQDSCTNFHVGYSFDVGGSLARDSAGVGYDVYAALTEGGPIAVRYVAGKPAVNEIEAGWTFFGGMLLLGFGAIFGAVGGIGIGFRVRTVRRRVQLRDHGTVRSATVTAQEPTNATVSNRKQWRIRWRDDAGAEGQSQGCGQGDLPQVGARITVYVDPGTVLPPVWEGDSGTRSGV